MSLLGGLFGGGSKSSSSSTTNNSYVDSRQVNTTSTDSHNYVDSSATSYSDDHSSVINWTGTDTGAVHMADLMANLAGAQTSAATEAQQIMAGLAGHVGDQSAHLAEVSGANAMLLSEHMLNLTGELIDKVSTGTESLVASQNSAGAAAASIVQAGAQQSAGVQKTLVIAACAIAAALVLAGKG